jgi:hypothetical protein
VTCGTHKLVVRAPGYLEQSRSLDVAAFADTQVAISLVKEALGTLVIAPDPVTAAITVDGVDAGSGPMTIESIGVGSHEVGVSADGFTAATRSAEITEGQTTRIDVALVRVGEGGSPPAPVGPGDGSPLPIARLSLDGGVGLLGIVLAGGGLYEYHQAHLAYTDYLAVADDDTAEAFYTDNVGPLARKSAIFGGCGLALLGASAALFGTTHVSLASDGFGPAVHGSW